MLSNKWSAIIIVTGTFILTNNFISSLEEHQPSQASQPSTKLDRDFMYYEKDMPDNLANPLDSSEEELNQEIEELEKNIRKRNSSTPQDNREKVQ